MRKEGCLSGSLTRMDGMLTGEELRIGEGLGGSLTRTGERLKGYVALICTSNRDAYLMVTKDTLWLTPDMIAENFDIVSNVKWNIE